ncbi:hypothetical protein CAC42_2507 [Sphaceloma murrayae]|uniref:RNA polymerase II degradation factor 1 n=1 Tax=Sphaceloma murrayae TaxID=2082308 RepID=A0A2K1QWJ5_9PEZI|nr:hypothetical protein CAC42_2507 [Sphaceloma murrayae]
MSEVDNRPTPSRGRSSVRGRGGYAGRGGPRGGHRQINGAASHQQEPSLDDQGEIGDMKKQYSSQLPMLKDMFPDWTDVDLVFALQETDGHVSQFSEIKKPKDRARSKAKDGAIPDQTSSALRGGRGRGGFEGARGGRGRGDRARGVSRGGRGGITKTSEPAAEPVTSTIPEANAWGAPAIDSTPAETSNDSSSGNVVTSEELPKTASEGTKPSSLPEGPTKKTWASMFTQPKPAPAPAAPKAALPPSLPAEAEVTPTPAPEVEPTPAEPEVPAPEVEKPVEAPIEPPTPAIAEALEPPHDALTEDNLENLPDTSIPPATQTVASNAGSEVRHTPVQQQPIGRPGLAVGGYASTAMRAAGITPRSASYQRRVAEQQEAVVLPGHNSVDRAAVQFGSMGLNGDGADVDEEREEPETRTQPPQQSPQGQPRASLPPAPLQSAAPTQEAYTGQSMPTPKQAPGLPPANPQHAQAAQAGAQDANSAIPQQLQHAYNQYGRQGQPDASAPGQKSYDPFSHQTPSAIDQFPSQTQAPGQQQQGQQHQSQAQSGYGGYSAAPSDYSQYYTSEQQRNAYQNYYSSSYGQQNQPQQDSSNAQQRAGSSLGSGQGEAAFAANQSAQQVRPQIVPHVSSSDKKVQGRYNDSQSGHNTPNPLGGAQQQSSAPQQAQQHSYGGAGGYPGYAGHPYFQTQYPTSYQSQGYGYGYGGGPYAQQKYPSHGYGMNAPSSYDHSSSPANSGFNQQSSLHSRDSGLGSGAGDYGRSSTQPSSLGGSGGGFGGASDYSRNSNYQGHGYGGQQASGSDDLKSFGDSKTGPSPANQPGRPGSAANSAAGQGQTQAGGLPPPQSQGFGGYPGFNQSYGGLGGLSGHQGGGGAQGGYGGYGGFSQNYNNQQYGRGGWGASYGH